MVLSEKNSENVRNGSSTSSGKRSTNTSPDIELINSNLNLDSNIDETGSPNRIKVGRKHQAICPDLSTTKKPPNSQSDRALLVWRPDESLSDEKLDDFLTLAIEKFNYNREQALGMLFWHKYDIDKAIKDLENFMPYEEEWSPEEKILFDQALVFHEKQFSLIRQMLPDKTIASLVRYYYHSKKARPKPSRVEVKSRKQVSTSIAPKDGNSEVIESNVANQEDKTANQRTKKWLVSSTKQISNAKGNAAGASGNGGGGHDGSSSGNSGKTAPITKVVANGAGIAERSKTESVVMDASTALSQQPVAAASSDKDKFQDEDNEIVCSHCKIECPLNHNCSPLGTLCNTCFQNWKKTGLLRAARVILGPDQKEVEIAAGLVPSTYFKREIDPKLTKTKIKDCIKIDEELLNNVADPEARKALMTKKKNEISLVLSKIRHTDQSIESVKRKLSEIEENTEDEIEEIAHFY